jgi:hypothetical protein
MGQAEVLAPGEMGLDVDSDAEADDLLSLPAAALVAEAHQVGGHAARLFPGANQVGHQVQAVHGPGLEDVGGQGIADAKPGDEQACHGCQQFLGYDHGKPDDAVLFHTAKIADEVFRLGH